MGRRSCGRHGTRSGGAQHFLIRVTLAAMSRSDHAKALEKQAREGSEGTPPVLAATVILLRDGSEGLETLMLKRNSKIAFGGMWVFPGGRIDSDDWSGVEENDDLAASRRAAVREAFEECGLGVDPNAMHPFSHWTPPKTTPRRFLTWFFAARAGVGEVAIDHGEIHVFDQVPEFAEVRVSVLLRGARGLEVALVSDIEFAEALAIQASGLLPSDLDPEMVADGVGEFLNVLCGNAASGLAKDGHRVEIGPPDYDAELCDGWVVDLAVGTGRAAVVLSTF
jgi:8-oxo-dGTP pyrophosphatase MutT (NUDIX family)